MSGETEKQVSGWTVDTLKEHLTALGVERDRRYEQRFQAQQDALLTAERESEKKNAELNDVRHRFIPREVFDTYKDEQAKKARSALITFVVMGLTIIGLVFSLLQQLST